MVKFLKGKKGKQNAKQRGKNTVKERPPQDTLDCAFEKYMFKCTATGAAFMEMVEYGTKSDGGLFSNPRPRCTPTTPTPQFF